MFLKHTSIAVIGLLFAAAGIASANVPPDPISLDRESPSVFTFGKNPGDIYGEGDGSGFDIGGVGPILQVSQTSLGLTSSDNIDAMSTNNTNASLLFALYFSADDASVGAVDTEYRHQADRYQAAGDRWVTNGLTTNTLAWVLANETSTTININSGTFQGTVQRRLDTPHLLSLNQTWYNEIPSIAPQTVNTYNPAVGATKMDDMDALDLDIFDTDVTSLYYSLDAASPLLASLSATKSDIILVPAGTATPGIFAAASTLGLNGANDDLDALVIWDLGTVGELDPGVDIAIFSLAPGSEYLTNNNFSAADIFVTDFSNDNTMFLTYDELGMLFTDNIDALEFENIVESFNAVPEPITLSLLLAGGGLCLLKRRR